MPYDFSLLDLFYEHLPVCPACLPHKHFEMALPLDPVEEDDMEDPGDAGEPVPEPAGDEGFLASLLDLSLASDFKVSYC